MPCNVDVNLITRLGVIALFSLLQVLSVVVALGGLQMMDKSEEHLRS
jgi:hypothetical protein